MTDTFRTFRPTGSSTASSKIKHAARLATPSREHVSLGQYSATGRADILLLGFAHNVLITRAFWGRQRLRPSVVQAHHQAEVWANILRPSAVCANILQPPKLHNALSARPTRTLHFLKRRLTRGRRYAPRLDTARALVPLVLVRAVRERRQPTHGAVARGPSLEITQHRIPVVQMHGSRELSFPSATTR